MTSNTDHSNLYTQFASEKVRAVYHADGTCDNTVELPLADVYYEFKQWFLTTCPVGERDRIPDRSVVRRELTSLWGQTVSGRWTGIQLIDGS